MASYTRRERTTRYVEFLVPLGDTYIEMEKAANAAYSELKTLYERVTPGDDQIRVYADDEHIIIRFEVTNVGGRDL